MLSALYFFPPESLSYFRNEPWRYRTRGVSLLKGTLLVSTLIPVTSKQNPKRRVNINNDVN